MKEMISDLYVLGQEERYDELLAEINKLDDTFEEIVFLAYYYLVKEEYEQAIETIRGSNIEDYFNEDRIEILDFASFVCYRLNLSEEILVLSKYLYLQTSNIKYKFVEYDVIVLNAETYLECASTLDAIIELTDDYSMFSTFTRGWIVFRLLSRSNVRGIRNLLSFSDEEILAIGTLTIKRAFLIAMEHENYQYIIDFVNNRSEFLLENLDYEILHAYREYVLAKQIQGLSVNCEDLLVLSNNNVFVIEFHELFTEFVNKCNFDAKTVELVSILNFKIKDYDELTLQENAIHIGLLNFDYDNMLTYLRGVGIGLANVIEWAALYGEYKKEYYDNYVDYLFNEYRNEGDNNFLIFFSIPFLYQSYVSKFQALISKFDFEKDLDYLLYYCYKNLMEKKEYELFSVYVDEIGKHVDESSSNYYDYTIIKLTELYNDGNSDKFQALYNLVEVKIDKEYLASFLSHTRSSNLEIDKFLVAKADLELSHFYNNSIDHYLTGTSKVIADKEMVFKCLELYKAYLNRSDGEYSCYYGKLAGYELFYGDKEKGYEYAKKSAYLCPSYCSCGIGALLMYNEEKFGVEKADEINIKIVLNSIDGEKLVGDDRYITEEFDIHGTIYTYYAYYALKGTKGFDLEKAINYLYTDATYIQSLYYQIKLAKALSYDHLLDELLYKIGALYAAEYYESDKRYMNILEDIDARLQRPSHF